MEQAGSTAWRKSRENRAMCSPIKGISAQEFVEDTRREVRRRRREDDDKSSEGRPFVKTRRFCTMIFAFDVESSGSAFIGYSGSAGGMSVNEGFNGNGSDIDGEGLIRDSRGVR